MRDIKGEDFIPAKNKLPAALDIFPAHLAQFVPARTYSDSVVRYNNLIYPSTAFIRDINPDPNNPYQGRSIVAASPGLASSSSSVIQRSETGASRAMSALSLAVRSALSRPAS